MEAAAGAKTPEMSKKIGKPTEPPAAQPTAAKFPERARANSDIPAFPRSPSHFLSFSRFFCASC
jgi:hypothetical protein